MYTIAKRKNLVSGQMIIRIVIRNNATNSDSIKIEKNDLVIKNIFNHHQLESQLPHQQQF